MTDKRSYGRSSSEITVSSSPYKERRDYGLGEGRLLVGVLDNPFYPPYIADCRHYHNCMEIGICISGKGRIQLGQQTWDFADGTIVAVGKGLRHIQQNEGDLVTHWQYVLVDEDAVLREAPPRYQAGLQDLIVTARQQGLYFPPDDEFQELHHLLLAMLAINRHSHTAARIELETMVYLLMIVMSQAQNLSMSGQREQDESRKLIEPSLQYVSKNYAKGIRVSQMAASCAMSESYFRKVFSNLMAMSPLEYINRYRVNRSMSLLRATEETILQIAVETGFPSVATYNRNFHRFIGKSPAEWRKSARIIKDEDVIPSD